MLEASALELFAMANLHYQLSWETKLSRTTNKGSPLLQGNFRLLKVNSSLPGDVAVDKFQFQN